MEVMVPNAMNAMESQEIRTSDIFILFQQSYFEKVFNS